MSTAYINRFLVQRKDIGIRIEFFEVIDDPAPPGATILETRGAKVMSLEDAKALHRVLGQILYPDTLKQ